MGKYQQSGDHIMEVSEKDWKLFRSKIAPWQEAYMDRLNREYLDILTGDSKASDKFWKIEERINKDKKSRGVVIHMRRSSLYMDLAALLNEGVITFADIEDFSDELKASLRYFCCRCDPI